MSKFCPHCRNLLYANITNDELVFKCMSCHEIFKSEPNDSLRYENVIETNIARFEKILNSAVDDPCVLKAHIPCIKCDNNIVKQVRVGQDMKLFNVCTSCRVVWLY